MESFYSLVRSLKSARSYELPHDPTAAYYSLLSYVMQKQHRIFIELIESSSNFDVNFVCGRSKRTLLHMAANVGAYECLQHLLKKGALPNVLDRQGITPLQVAARNGFIRCIVKLLEYKADIEIRNNEGMTAIHWLASNGRTEVFSEIIKYVKDVDVKDDNLQTPLHVACLNGHLSTTLKLLELNADMEMKNVWGCTPLYFACRHGHSEIVAEFLKRGATFQTNHDGESPLDAAVKGGYPHVCVTLLEWDPNLFDEILQSCHREVESKKVKKILTYLMYHNNFLRDQILLFISKAARNEGMKLLSPNSDYEKFSETYLRNIEILTHLLSFDPRGVASNQNDDSRSRGRHDRISSDSARSRLDSLLYRNEASHTEKHFNQYAIEPENVLIIITELTVLWEVLESWMTVLQIEVANCPEKKPVLENMENGTLDILKAEASSLRGQASCTSPLLKQASRNSTNLERLRWSQPALQYSFFDSGEVPDDYDCILDPSYDSLSRASEEDYETQISFQHVSDNPSSNSSGRSCIEEASNLEPVISDQISGVLSDNIPNLLQNDADVPSTSNANLHRPNCTVSSQVSVDDVDVDKVMDMTGDRLCCLIQGFYRYSQGHSIWRKLEGKMSAFNKFIKRYEDVLLLLVSRKPQLIFEHFSFILENPILLQQFLPAIHKQPLSERQKWFYERIGDRREETRPEEEYVINVARASLLQTSCKMLSDKNENILKENLSVRFIGEDGMGTGVTREWFDLLVKEILNPDCALFTLSTDGSTFQPNCNSAINPDHLSYFQFVGRIMGLALYHKHLITAYFTRSFYKHILGIPVSYKDVESIDPEYSKNLQWVLDNSIDHLGGLDITFSVETDVFGHTQEVELKPGGKGIPVTDENKVEYVHLAADLRMTKAIKHQMFAFLKGFYEFVPHSLASLFNEYELELMMSGIPEIDIGDWQKNTTYQAGYNEDSLTIKWFWETVANFTDEEKSQLLQFVTGTSRVPWGGFSNLSGVSGSLFTICRIDGTSQTLPTASTCFNMMKLPEYSSKEILAGKLKTALSYGRFGFEFT